MAVAYVAITVLTAFALGYAAYLNFVRADLVVAAAERVQVSESWMYPLGSLLATGALGLLVGLVVPGIGTAAAAGVVLYFICAVAAHVRLRDSQLGSAAAFLTLAVAALAAGLAHRGPW